MDIEGWLGGTCARYLTKPEKAIWSDIIVLGGKGKGRFGFVELYKGAGYSRQQLLEQCQCYTLEDIATFDACIDKCVNGTTDGDYVDAPRLVLHPNNVYEIVNWDNYQHSDFPKGLTEEEAKALKRSKLKDEQPDLGKKINRASYVKHLIDTAVAKAKAVDPEIADTYLDEKCSPTTKELRAANRKLIRKQKGQAGE